MIRTCRSISRCSSIDSELPSYDLVIPALLEFGIGSLRDKCQLTPGVPLKPMLAKPTKAIGEVLDRFENKKFTCEYKYDGERAQVWAGASATCAVLNGPILIGSLAPRWYNKGI